MFFTLFARRSAPVSATPRAPGGPQFRPQLEGFEDRVVPAAPVDLGPAAVAPAAASPASVLPIDITSVTLDPATGILTAVGKIGNQAFDLAGQLTLQQNGNTPILHLEINEIHLDLLGLKVDTSPICLDITAESGSGNLLGNLLTDVAGLLDGGGALPGIGDLLGGLTTGAAGQTTNELADLNGELTGLLNGVFDALTSSSAVTGATGNILHLSLGPVELDLLGLVVNLDDCDGGPVTVDVTAESGPGKLLGNLLGGLTHLLDTPANGNAIANKIGKIAGQIGQLTNV